MKVFTVNHTWRCLDDYKSSTVSLGVFLSKEEAQACLKKQRDEELENSYTAWNLKGASGEDEDEFCGEIEFDEAQYFEVQFDEHNKYDIIEVEQKELNASPSAIITTLRQSMWDDIDNIAQAPVPGYHTCRPAAIDLRGEQFKKLSFRNGDQLVKVDAYIPFGGLAVIVKCADGEERPGLVDPKAFDTDEILELHTVITNIKHPVRAFNPFWLMDSDWHDTLLNILNKTEEEYQEFISNNPKNK